MRALKPARYRPPTGPRPHPVLCPEARRRRLDPCCDPCPRHRRGNAAGPMLFAGLTSCTTAGFQPTKTLICRFFLFRRVGPQAQHRLGLAGDADIGTGDDAGVALADDATVGPHRAAGKARLDRGAGRPRRFRRGRCHRRVGGNRRDRHHGRGQACDRSRRCAIDRCVIEPTARHRLSSRRGRARSRPHCPACKVARDNGKRTREKHNAPTASRRRGEMRRPRLEPFRRCAAGSDRHRAGRSTMQQLSRMPGVRTALAARRRWPK
jgi:hypothetical protein